MAAQAIFRSLESVSSIVDEMARGKKVALEAVRPDLLATLRLTREFAVSSDNNGGTDPETRQVVERLTEQGMRLLTRVRKLVPKKDDTGGNTAKAYIKAIALFLLWHKSSGNAGSWAEERLTLAAKAAIELFEYTEDNAEIVACAQLATSIYETTIVQEHKDNTRIKEELIKAAFKSYEILVNVTLERVSASAHALAHEIARLVAALMSLTEYNQGFSWRAVNVATHASKRLMRGEHFAQASKCLRAASGTIESVITTSKTPAEHILPTKLSILFYLSTCYVATKEPVKALTCLNEILELYEASPPESIRVPLGKIALQKIHCLLQGQDDSIKQAVEAVVKLAASDLKAALRGAQAIVGCRNYDTGSFTVYEELAHACLPTDRAGLIQIRLAHLHSLVLSLQLAPVERRPRLLQEITRVAECLSQVDRLGDADRIKALDLVKRASWLASKSGREGMSWASRLCDVLLRLTDDVVAREQAICMQAHAMVDTGDLATAVTLAREAYEKNPSKRSRLSYLWVVSKSHSGEAVLSALKDLLANENGVELLDSLMTLVDMLDKTPTPNGANPRRFLATVLEEWLRIWTEQELQTVAFRHTNDEKCPLFFSVIVDLVQIVLHQYSPAEAAADDDTSFSSALLSIPAAQDEIWRIMCRYVEPVLTSWTSSFSDKTIVGPLARSKAEVKWLASLCWNLGAEKLRAEDVERKKEAGDSFLVGFRLLVAAETPTDGHLILNDEEEKDKVLMLLAAVSSSISGLLLVDENVEALPVELLNKWMKKLAPVRARISDMMTKPLYLALAKNLQKTEFIIEILLSVCSTEQLLWKLLQSEDTVALLHELPVEVLHLLAVHVEEEPHNDQATATKFLRLCLKKCKEGPGADPDKALWIYRDLFRCAPNRAASLSVLHEFRQLLEDQVTEDMGAGQAGTVADHFCVEAYNQGVACLVEMHAAAAETFLLNALSILPHTDRLFDNPDFKEKLTAYYAVAQDLQRKQHEKLLNFESKEEEEEDEPLTQPSHPVDTTTTSTDAPTPSHPATDAADTGMDTSA